MIGIYKITNTINGKSYIGQSVAVEYRFKQHQQGRHDSLISRKIGEYGLNNFLFEILEECPKKLLNEREVFYVEKFQTLYPKGYNLVSPPRKEYVERSKELSEEQVLEVCQQLELGYSPSDIAESLAIPRPTIYRINKGDCYAREGISYPIQRLEGFPNYCKQCGVEILPSQTFCSQKCYAANLQLVERPSREDLKRLIREESFTSIGKKYGVSDNAIRKWCKVMSLPSRVKDIKNYSESEWIDL